mmetsp:Transcript_24747/g.84743  ORF Transcript_24747/g.84743 Transcript_24747/m.84743 type:complete len:269 (-) Transcript_24747:87-893(-)
MPDDELPARHGAAARQDAQTLVGPVRLVVLRQGDDDDTVAARGAENGARVAHVRHRDFASLDRTEDARGPGTLDVDVAVFQVLLHGEERRVVVDVLDEVVQQLVLAPARDEVAQLAVAVQDGVDVAVRLARKRLGNDVPVLVDPTWVARFQPLNRTDPARPAPLVPKHERRPSTAAAARRRVDGRQRAAVVASRPRRPRRRAQRAFSPRGYAVRRQRRQAARRPQLAAVVARDAAERRSLKTLLGAGAVGAAVVDPPRLPPTGARNVV